jgi:hypothetical protein
MGIWRHRLAKLSRLSAAELGDLCVAQWVLLRAQLLVWVLPQGRLLGGGGGGEPRRCSERELALASRLALAVSRAAEHGVFRPACLVRAIALERWLRRRGIEAGRVRVGVRWQGGAFSAHAWVELNEQVLGDAEWHVRAFTPLGYVRSSRP